MKKVAKNSIGSKPSVYSLPTENDGVCEILVDIDALKSSSVNLILSNKAGEKVSMTYSPMAQTMSVDRTKSGITDFSESFPAVTDAPTLENEGKVALRIFIDRSSIELFGNNGRFVMTNLVFPTEPYTTLSINTTGGNAKIENLKIYSIKKITQLRKN